MIRREDVEHVREHSPIEEIVGEYVTLKNAGVGSRKGLCPFHDERTPSFHVRPPVGLWHCFGCGEGGDVISFLQKIDHLSFAEAVERLAARLGYELRYEDEGGGKPRRERTGQRQRLIEANRVSAQFYGEQLMTSPDASTGRDFLTERGFDRGAAEQFGVGFAPRGNEVLLRHLRGRGFTEDELLSSGLAGRGQRGLYDRFRGRLVWPIRDVTGDVVGFGARRLFEDDRIEAKYLNTPETSIYRKSQVLYGVDLAKRQIARKRQVVVVEGYTDVMACHLAGIDTAVATCGTAFGADHIRVVRRLLGDDGTRGGQVIFTFDGDAAGQQAAMRAFEEDQRFVAQTFVAVAREGADPCELRQQRGDQAVLDLIASKQPLFDFAIRTTLARFDLDTAEGRVQGARAGVPIVARIRDIALRDDYARRLAGWLGLPENDLLRRVRAAQRTGPRQAPGETGHRPGSGAVPSNPERPGRGPAAPTTAAPGRNLTGPGGPGRPGRPPTGPERPGPGHGPGHPPGAGPTPEPSDPAPIPRPNLRDPNVRMEHQALECLLQVPHLLPVEEIDGLGPSAFTAPAHREIHTAIRRAGGLAVGSTTPPALWADAVRSQCPPELSGLVTELAVATLPADNEDVLSRYAVSVVLHLVERETTQRIETLRGRMQRMAPTDPDVLAALGELTRVEAHRRDLHERIAGV
ncbi:MAG: primase [Actinomycetota bacterium]|nr:primase [Actinomycetota bacterium]